MPNAAFQVVDKSSGKDLFFNVNAKYKLGDVNLFRINDKTRQDTIKPKVFGTGDQRVFLILMDFSKPTDTLIIKIADTPDDRFIYTVKKATSACVGYQLDQAYFNNTEVDSDKGIFIFKK